MAGCLVCNIPCKSDRCKACFEVFHFVSQLTEPQRQDYILVVDGSFSSHPPGKGHRPAGAGLVLAREYDESVVACASVPFKATTSNVAESEAIRCATRWAPGISIWSDSKPMVKYWKRLGFNVYDIPQHMRDPLHNLAHKLANIARLDDWDKLERVWVPGEVWP